MLKIHSLRFDATCGFHIQYQIESHEDAIALASIIRGFASLIKQEELPFCKCIFPDTAYIETLESNMDIFPDIIRTVSLNVEDTSLTDFLSFGCLNTEDAKRISCAYRKGFDLPNLPED